MKEKSQFLEIWKQVLTNKHIPNHFFSFALYLKQSILKKLDVNYLVCSAPLDKWSPALQIRTVLLSIQALLSAPNPDDPLANDVAELWKVNESKAIETGK